MLPARSDDEKSYPHLCASLPHTVSGEDGVVDKVRQTAEDTFSLFEDVFDGVRDAVPNPKVKVVAEMCARAALAMVSVFKFVDFWPQAEPRMGML